MAFVKKRGRTKWMWLPVTPSTEITAGSLVAWSSGKLIAATATTRPHLIAGVIRHTISSSDSDYASDRLVEVEVPIERFVEWEADVSAENTLTTSDIGGYYELSTALLVNTALESYRVVQCVGYINDNKGRFILNIGPDAMAGYTEDGSSPA